MKIGILALQGAVQPHVAKLTALGAEVVEVRRASHLASVSGIILPGGESTTMIHLLKLNSLWEPLVEFTSQRPSWGICAGSILLAKKVTHPEQVSLNQMDIAVTRNAYGRQNESFIAPLKSLPAWDGPVVEGVFIRAPKIDSVGPGVQALLAHDDEIVMAKEGHLVASTFHPELTESDFLHRYFANLCQSHR